VLPMCLERVLEVLSGSLERRHLGCERDFNRLRRLRLLRVAGVLEFDRCDLIG
jgi:hypothetical protein